MRMVDATALQRRRWELGSSETRGRKTKTLNNEYKKFIPFFVRFAHDDVGDGLAWPSYREWSMRGGWVRECVQLVYT